MTASVCKKITSQLIAALEKQEDVLVQLEALDILADMLGRYEPKSLVTLLVSPKGCLDRVDTSRTDRTVTRH